MPRNTAFSGFVEDIIARWRMQRGSVRTRRLVSQLPPRIRKDIGWPDPFPDPASRRNSPGGWFS